MERRFSCLFDGKVTNHDTDQAVEDLDNLITRDLNTSSLRRSTEQLSYRIKCGDYCLKWKNTTNPTNPLIALNDSISLSNSAELLNYILYNQLVDDFQSTGKSIELAKEIFDKINLTETVVQGGIYSKNIHIDSRFLDILQQGNIFGIYK